MGSLTTSETFHWTVTNTNRAPVVTAPADQTSAEGAVITLPIVATDPDGDTLTVSATGLPPGLSMNATTGEISGTLPFDAAGGYTVTVVGGGRIADDERDLHLDGDEREPRPGGDGDRRSDERRRRGHHAADRGDGSRRRHADVQRDVACRLG